MYEELYLRKLKTIYSDMNTAKCYVQIPILKKEYKHFEIVPCNDKGLYITTEEESRIIKAEDILDGKIYFERSKFCDKYYKIVSVLYNGAKLQDNENNIENLVCIKILPIVIKYSLLNSRKKLLSFLKQDEDMILKIQCTENIKCGEIGYVKNGIYFPLPSINKQVSFLLPFKDNNITLVNASKELNYIYKREV